MIYSPLSLSILVLTLTKNGTWMAGQGLNGKMIDKNVNFLDYTQ